MLIVRGVNIYPAQIEDVLLSSECVSPHYEIHLTRDRSLDQIEVRVEIDRDDLGNTDQVCDQLAKRLHQVMGIKATITLAESMTLARSEGKARRVHVSHVWRLQCFSSSELLQLASRGLGICGGAFQFITGC